MYKIGVIGDRESSLGFMAVGFTVRIADGAEEAAKALKSLEAENCAVIFITEELAELIREDIQLYKDKTLPSVVMIPSKSGSKGIGMTNIKKSVERAVGADILFKNN